MLMGVQRSFGAPARVGSEAVMYDRVRGTIVRKTGSGNLTAGPDVSEAGF